MTVSFQPVLPFLSAAAAAYASARGAMPGRIVTLSLSSRGEPDCPERGAMTAVLDGERYISDTADFPPGDPVRRALEAAHSAWSAWRLSLALPLLAGAPGMRMEIKGPWDCADALTLDWVWSLSPLAREEIFLDFRRPVAEFETRLGDVARLLALGPAADGPVRTFRIGKHAVEARSPEAALWIWAVFVSPNRLVPWTRGGSVRASWPEVLEIHDQASILSALPPVRRKSGHRG